MGDRGQVLIKDNGVYLYTHWGASDLVQTVRAALARGKDRWHDDEYLTRIIFSEMIKDDLMGTTGYGIGHSEHGDCWNVISVDCSKQIVSYCDREDEDHEIAFDDFIVVE